MKKRRIQAEAAPYIQYLSINSLGYQAGQFLEGFINGYQDSYANVIDAFTRESPLSSNIESQLRAFSKRWQKANSESYNGGWFVLVSVLVLVVGGIVSGSKKPVRPARS